MKVYRRGVAAPADGAFFVHERAMGHAGDSPGVSDAGATLLVVLDRGPPLGGDVGLDLAGRVVDG